MRQTQDRIVGEGDLRESINRLDGLPLRSETARRWLERFVQGSNPLSSNGRQPPPEVERLDPGWTLAGSSLTEAERLALIADRSWWRPLRGASAEAVDRLWRYSVATSRAARRLAVEANDPDPSAIARAGLLHAIGLWALAVVDPDRLGLWIEEPDPDRRRDREQEWFGQSLAMFGRSLARRWGCEPIVSDAAWLIEVHSGELDPLAEDPDGLALLRKAVAWAERTPWSLRRQGPRSLAESDPPLRWLMAEVQSLCGPGLVGGGPLDIEELVRSTARRLRQESLNRLELVAERDQLGKDLEATIEAINHRHGQAEEARRLDKLEALAEFSAGASHELNNPLAVIVGRAQLLQVRIKGEDQDAARSLETIISQAKRAHAILRDLMYLARPPAPRPRACLPDEILRQSLAGLVPEAQARQVRLLGQTREPGPVAWADPDALRHLAEVLLRNALEASSGGGTVQATAEGDDRTLVWTIRDGGRGLSTADEVHLLDPFYCGRQAGRGLGLGLPRIARYLQQVGGSIRWRSDPNHGTTFRVKMPMEPPPAPL
ncbi:hypothetical protein BH23PLA1_BH23PLA1_25620 [soil metagenome]